MDRPTTDHINLNAAPQKIEKPTKRVKYLEIPVQILGKLLLDPNYDRVVKDYPDRELSPHDVTLASRAVARPGEEINVSPSPTKTNGITNDAAAVWRLWWHRATNTKRADAFMNKVLSSIVPLQNSPTNRALDDATTRFRGAQFSAGGVSSRLWLSLVGGTDICRWLAIEDSIRVKLPSLDIENNWHILPSVSVSVETMNDAAKRVLMAIEGKGPNLDISLRELFLIVHARCYLQTVID